MAFDAVRKLAAHIEPVSFAALRIVAGSMFAFHGAQKLFGWAATSPTPPAGSQLWLGGIIELAAGLLIAVGLFARPAAILASGTMAVAYIQFHWKLALADWKWLPAINRGELAALYCFVFLFIATHGPGRASLDQRFR
jgi:putative oxidoreductase